jgi:hypothetical protein
MASGRVCESTRPLSASTAKANSPGGHRAFSPTGKGLLSPAPDRPRVVPDCGQRRHARARADEASPVRRGADEDVSSRTPRACGRSQAALSLERDDRISRATFLPRCAEPGRAVGQRRDCETPANGPWVIGSGWATSPSALRSAILALAFRNSLGQRALSSPCSLLRSNGASAILYRLARLVPQTIKDAVG